MVIEEVGLNISDILNEFVVEERFLLQINANEATISSQLKDKLKRCLPDWHVDCEYNRKEEEVKELRYAISRGGERDVHRVTPDIIIHRRNTQDNLLAIEIKKTTNKEDRFKDQSKLQAFREQLGYRYTLFVDFKIDKENPGIHDSVLISNDR